MECNKTYVKVAGVVVCGVPQLTDSRDIKGQLVPPQFHGQGCLPRVHHFCSSKKLLLLWSWQQPRCSGTAKRHTLSSVLFPQDETHHPTLLKQLLIGDKSKQQYKMVRTREVSKILLLIDCSIAPKYH